MIAVISVEQLHELTRKLGPKDVILDVRTPEEFSEGHVPGAKNIPVQELEDRSAELKGTEHLYIYCRSGRRVDMAASVLDQQGLDQLQIRDLLIVNEGGFPDWEDQGFPSEK